MNNATNVTLTACTILTQKSANACGQRWGARLKGIATWAPGTYALVDCVGTYPTGQVAR